MIFNVQFCIRAKKMFSGGKPLFPYDLELDYRMRMARK